MVRINNIAENNSILTDEYPMSFLADQDNFEDISNAYGKSDSAPVILIITCSIIVCIIVFVLGFLVKRQFYDTNSSKRFRSLKLGLSDSKISLENDDFITLLKSEEANSLKFNALESITNQLRRMNDFSLRVFIQDCDLEDRSSLEDTVLQREVTIIEGSRCFALPCLQESIVDCDVHANKLLDLANNPLFIGAVPMANGMNRFLDFLIDHQIGTILLIGRIKPVSSGTPALGYIPIKAGAELTFGKWTLKTLNFDKNNFYDLVTVEAHMIGHEPTVLKILSVPYWPTVVGRMDKNVCLERASIPIMVENLISSPRCKLQPGILFQCRNGVHLAPSVLAVYLSWQLYKCERLINVVAVLKYIQNHRFGAFSLSPVCTEQIPIVFAMVKCMITESTNLDQSSDKLEASTDL